MFESEFFTDASCITSLNNLESFGVGDTGDRGAKICAFFLILSSDFLIVFRKPDSIY